MGALNSVFVACASLMATPSIADPPTLWSPLIAEASVRFGVPIDWITRVIRIESGGKTIRNGHPIRSRVGAMGLMQLMPATWVQMRVANGLGFDPDDPRDNIMAGTAYLRLMYDRFGYPGLFAAYNAGPGRYAGALATGRPLPLETQTYLASATGLTSDATVQVGPQRGATGLFFALSTGVARDRGTTADGLFVAGRTSPQDGE